MGGTRAPRLLPRALLAAAACLLLGGAASASEETSLFRLGPEDIGTYGHKVDHLYAVILWITTATFVLTEGLLLFFVLRFRARPGGKAVYTHGNHRLEVVWTLIPGAILFWLALYQTGAWREIKIERPAPGEGPVVQVLAKQFEWQIRYAGPDGKFGTGDDVTKVNDLHVPAGKKVTVLLRSMDVIHSFFLPNIRLKQDAVPGLTIPQWFQAVKTTAQARKERKERGDPGADEFQFEIACAELCGIQHTSMRGTLVVHEEADFLAWLDGEYVAKVHEYGTNPDALINRHWPATENRIEDSWTRDRWPADLKAKWPPKGK